MALRSTPERWGSLARGLHWGTLFLLLALVLLGYYMTGLPMGAAKMKVYALHKSIGIVALGVAVLRVLWRLADRRPAAVAMALWQRLAAAVTVLGLYALLFLLPLSGWFYNSAAGFPLRWFNLVNLPALTGPDPLLKVGAKEVHEVAAVVLIVLVVVHVLGALKHHLIDRDQTLLRMLSSRRGER